MMTLVVPLIFKMMMVTFTMIIHIILVMMMIEFDPMDLFESGAFYISISISLTNV